MLVIQIIIAIAIIGVSVYGIRKFNNHCESKFGYCFFTMYAFILLFAAVGLYSLGHYWYVEAAKQNGDTLNGVILIGFSGCIAIGLAYMNFRRTNIAYGVGGTTVQFVVFGWLAMAAWPLALLLGFLSLFSTVGAERVYVVNKD